MSDDPAFLNAEKRGRPFEVGNNASPGRPKGSRNKLGEAFVTDLYDAWQAQGADVIQTVIAEKPDQFLKVIASLLPKEVKIETTSDLTDEQLNARISSIVAAVHALEGGIGLPAGGAEAPTGTETAH